MADHTTARKALSEMAQNLDEMAASAERHARNLRLELDRAEEKSRGLREDAAAIRLTLDALPGE